jgi:hypothetical protein
MQSVGSLKELLFGCGPCRACPRRVAGALALLMLPSMPEAYRVVPRLDCSGSSDQRRNKRQWPPIYGNIRSRPGKREKAAEVPTAAHRIQVAIGERAMIFERGEPRSVVGLAHDLLHSSQRGPFVAGAGTLANALADTVTLVTHVVVVGRGARDRFQT